MESFTRTRCCQSTAQTQGNKAPHTRVRYTFRCTEGALKLYVIGSQERAKAYPLEEAVLSPNRSHHFLYSTLFQYYPTGYRKVDTKQCLATKLQLSEDQLIPR